MRFGYILFILPWLFPVGDEVHAPGYPDMFTDMFDALEQGREPVELEIWRGKEGISAGIETVEYDELNTVAKYMNTGALSIG